MIAIAIAAALLLPGADLPTPSPAVSVDAVGEISFAKNPRRFREVLQPVQYEGDYSPAVGRPPEPEPAPNVPVRYVPEWMRQIPVIVPPAPRYVTEDELQSENASSQTRQQAVQTRQQPVGPAFNTAYETSGEVEDQGPIQLPPVSTSGSATGSNAVANYSSPPDRGRSDVTITTSSPR